MDCCFICGIPGKQFTQPQQAPVKTVLPDYKICHHLTLTLCPFCFSFSRRVIDL